MLTRAMIDAIERTDLFPVATASADGVPNVVPVRFVGVLDLSRLWIADNYFNKTAANLGENPQAALYLYSAEPGLSVQIKGTTTRVTQGPEYQAMRDRVLAANPNLPARALVIMSITGIFECLPGPSAGLPVGPEPSAPS